MRSSSACASMPRDAADASKNARSSGATHPSATAASTKSAITRTCTSGASERSVATELPGALAIMRSPRDCAHIPNFSSTRRKNSRSSSETTPSAAMTSSSSPTIFSRCSASTRSL